MTAPYVAEVLSIGTTTITTSRGVNDDGTPGAVSGVACDFTARLVVGSMVLVQDLGGVQVAVARLGNAQGRTTVSTDAPAVGEGWFNANVFVRPDPDSLDPELWIQQGTGV